MIVSLPQPPCTGSPRISSTTLCSLDPTLRSCFIAGSSHGWLVIADERSNLLLVNPITRAQIVLPPAVTIKNVQGCYTAEGVLDSYTLLDLDLDLETQGCNLQACTCDLSLEEGRFFFYWRVAMSADPSSGNCIVMILHMPEKHISFTRVGDTQWTWINVHPDCFDYCDVFYNDSSGLFYAMRRSGEVHTIDVNGPYPVVKVILNPMTRSRDSSRYIVQAPWGAILQVWRNDQPIRRGEYRSDCQA